MRRIWLSGNLPGARRTGGDGILVWRREIINKFFASGQAIREASLTVLRPTVHGSERETGAGDGEHGDGRVNSPSTPRLNTLSNLHQQVHRAKRPPKGYPPALAPRGYKKLSSFSSLSEAALPPPAKRQTFPSLLPPNYRLPPYFPSFAPRG